MTELSERSIRLLPPPNRRINAGSQYLTRAAALLLMAWTFGQTGWAVQSSFPFGVTASGAASLVTSGSSAATVGQAQIQLNAGAAETTGFAIFGLTQNGILVTEAAVPASVPITGGRIYAELSSSVNTGIAIANAEDQPATISFHFTDAIGGDFGHGTLSIPANGQSALFLDQHPFNSESPFRGTFTFRSPTPVAAVALRGLTNEREEFLITTLPVAELTSPVSEVVVFPHYADGGGWTTQILLVNPTDFPMGGTLQFSNDVGTHAEVGSPTRGSQLGTFQYSIAPRSSQRLRTGGAGDFPSTGWIRISPDQTSGTPSSVGVFSFKAGGITLTEAGVPTVRSGRSFRLYAEASGNFADSEVGSTQTGVAIANANDANQVANVTFELFGLDGTSTGLRTTVAVPPNGQTATFLNQLAGFEALESPFQGILRLSTDSVFGIAIVGLRVRYNERGDLLATTTPPVEAQGATGGLVFPHLVDGGGYTTQFILLSTSDEATSGSLNFVSQNGSALNVSITSDDDPSRLLSTTQMVSAAAGGTFELPGTGLVTIPAGFLRNDQQVTVEVLESMPRQVPSDLLRSTGPAVSITFPRGAANPVSRFDLTSGESTAPPGAAIQIDFDTTLLPDTNSYLPIAEVIPPQITASQVTGLFVAPPAGLDPTIVIPASMIEILSQGVEDEVFTVNVGNVTWNPSLPKDPVRLGPRIWNRDGLEWLATDGPTLSIRSGVKTCVLVHGMMSTVEGAYREGSSCVNDIATANGCDQVVGFNYDWSRGINQSGLELARFLDQLASDGISDIVLEAHSEGGPVALAAGAQTGTGTQISQLVTLGSPLTGTPAADRGSQILTWLAYGFTGSCPTCTVTGGPGSLPLRDFVNSVTPFLDDLTTRSGADGVLAGARNGFNQKHSQTPVTAIAGTGGSLVSDGLAAVTGAAAIEVLRPAFNAFLFGGEQQDSIVNGESALGTASNLNIQTALTFAVTHTELECDPQVIAAVGRSVNPTTPAGPANLSVSPSGLTFSATAGGAAPASQSFTVRNIGAIGSFLTVSVSDNASWITLTGQPRSLGAGDNQAFAVSIDHSGLSATTHSGAITVTDTASNRAETIAVTLTVGLQPTVYRVRLTKQGAGRGAVTSVPPGIDCGVLCQGQDGIFQSGTEVILVALAESGSTFDGWTGACVNATGNCVLQVDSDQGVIAKFSATPTTFSGNISATGRDSTSFPPCIFSHGISVTLTMTVSGSGTTVNPYTGTYVFDGTDNLTVAQNSPGNFCFGDVIDSRVSNSYTSTTGKVEFRGTFTVVDVPVTIEFVNGVVSGTTLTGSIRISAEIFDQTVTVPVTLRSP